MGVCRGVFKGCRVTPLLGVLPFKQRPSAEAGSLPWPFIQSPFSGRGEPAYFQASVAPPPTCGEESYVQNLK